MTEEAQAALDDNMPPLEEVVEEVKAEEVTDTTAVSEETEVPKEETPAAPEISKEQKALNQLAFEKREEKRQRIALEEKLAKLEAQTPAQPVVQGEPKLEDFDYDDSAFQAALIDYKVNEGLKTVEQRQSERVAEERQQSVQKAFNAKVSKLTETVPNYAENVGNLPDFPSDTLSTIMQMDNGPEVANYLGLHANIADDIAGLNPMQAAVKLGQISSQLSTLKPEIKTSAAPEPIEPVSASGSLAKDVSDMSMEEIYNS